MRMSKFSESQIVGMVRSMKWTVLVLWVPVIATGVVTAEAWADLPSSVAVHFDARLQPDLWLPKTVAIAVLGHLLVATAILGSIMSMRRDRGVNVASSLLWISGLSLAAAQIVRFNADGVPPQLWPVGALFAAAVAVMAGKAMTSSRASRKTDRTGSSANLSIDASGAPGIHRSWPQAVASLAVWIPLLVLLFRARGQALAVLIPINLIIGYGAGIFVFGFRYRVRDGRLEIRDFVRRVAVFELAAIRSAEVVTTNALADWGGWGIRGFGPSKAYLLGGDVALKLTLSDRQIWLGLKNAEQFASRVSPAVAEGKPQ